MSEQLHEALMPQVLSRIQAVLFAKVRTRVSLDDVCQDVFLDMFVQIRKGQSNLTTDREFVSWVLSIAVNKARKTNKDATRQKRDVSRDLHLADDMRLESVCSTSGQQSLSEWNDTIDRLNPKHQEIVRMLMLDYTKREIAARQGVNERTIRRHVKEIQVALESFHMAS
ncbi:MAG: sigma-70 family RNA polymerase sigma factor [Pirellulaceae bacterium]